MEDKESSDSKKSPKSDEWWSNFRQLLSEQAVWPSEYMFKFIVPKAGLEALREVFGDEEIIVRASSGGKYLSVTARILVQTPDDVVDIYTEAGKIEDVISL